MRQILTEQKGMALVEVLVSMAILVIIALAFILVYTTAFSNTYAFGKKNAAMALASEAMEALYAIEPAAEGTIAAKLSSLNGNQVSSRDELYLETGHDFNYLIEPVATLNGATRGHKVTIAVFYEAEQRHVTLATFIRGVD